jgi:hypothetical protein
MAWESAVLSRNQNDVDAYLTERATRVASSKRSTAESTPLESFSMFLDALHRFARVRRRDGASRWGVYRDTENPANYIETFIVESWAEHLRQHERLTSADRELEENVGRFESKPVKVRHFIYSRSKRGRQ